MSKNTYKNSISKILFNLKAINPNLKIILALSTVVYERDSNNIDEKWNVKINERNLAMSEIASDNGYVINDLNIVSKKLPLNMRKADGIHYEPCAYAVFADKVSEVLKAHL